jgi:hypothetical protein
MEAEYLFLGHSSEVYQSYEERKKLPPGYKLLLLAECDIRTNRPDIEKAIDLAGAKTLNVSKFRVFNEGDPYPSLRIHLLNDYHMQTNPGAINYVGIGRSGVYSVPLDLEHFKGMEEFVERYWHLDEEKRIARYYYNGLTVKIGIKNNNIFEDLKKTLLVNEDSVESDIIEFQFEDAYFPKKKDLKELLKTSKTLDDLHKQLTFSIEDLFEKLGPGTYIVPTCRSVNADAGDDEQDLFNYIADEIDPELADKLTLRSATNKLAYRKQKIEFLNSIKNHPKLQEEAWKEKLELVRRKLERIVKTIQNTRAKSTLKQRGVQARKRKTRKQSITSF